MYLFFQAWSPFLRSVPEGLPKGDHIIKVYTATEDPRLTIRPDLAVWEISDEPFAAEENFSYEARGTWTGPDLEQHLQSLNLPEHSQRRLRALFRFSNLPETGFCQAAMATQIEGNWLINHPFEDIDGIELATISSDEWRTELLHLDIFFAESLAQLFLLLATEGHEGDAIPEGIMRYREALNWLNIEGKRRRSKE